MSCIIVAGVYRSGSSAVAGVLNNLGVYMGKSFDTPTKNNISGYWEDLEFKEFHNCLHSLYVDKKEPYIKLIKSRKSMKLWGIKDPNLKNCLTHFYSTLNDLEIEHKLIVCERKEEEIVRSVSKVLGRDDCYIQQLVKTYLKDLLFHEINYPGPKIYVKHEDLINSTENEIKKICDFVGVQYKKEANEFIRN